MIRGLVASDGETLNQPTKMTLEELIQELNSIRQLRGGEIKIEVTAYTRECDYHELKISSIKADTNRDCPVVKIIAE